MTGTDATVPQRTAEPVPDSGGDRDRRSRWPLLGAAVGVGGVVSTVVFDVRPQPPDSVVMTAPGLLESVDRVAAHAGFVTGFLTVAGLLVLAAAWRRRVEPRAPSSTAARVVSAGLTASAAALTLGYGWKGALGAYLPGGLESTAFDLPGLYVYLMLNDFGGYIGWLGVVVAAGGVAWMGLRERLVSRWIGAVSLVPVLVTAGMAIGMSLAGSPAIGGPIWMVVAFTGLAFGRSTIAR